MNKPGIITKSAENANLPRIPIKNRTLLGIQTSGTPLGSHSGAQGSQGQGSLADPIGLGNPTLPHGTSWGIKTS